MNINAKKYIENYLKIRTKDAELKPLIFNSPQKRLYEKIKEISEQGKPIRIIILKARQMGFSTATGGIMFKNTATKRFVQTAIITHRDSTTNELFEMYKRFYNNLPDELKPELQASNAKEVIFNSKQAGKGLDSKIKVMTASDDGVGRGGTTQYVHMSEFAFWKNAKDVYTAIMQCVPDSPNSMVIIESTANGYNYFKDLWDKAVSNDADNEFVPIFFAWYEMPDYTKPYYGFELTSEEKELKEKFHLTNDQLTWRRWCISNNCGGDLDKFKQEYPSTPEEAFVYSGNSFFNIQEIKRAKELCCSPKKKGQFSIPQQESDDNYNYKPVNAYWSDDNRGYIRIFEEPNSSIPYVIGGDTAGEGSDAFVAQVLNNITGEQVAVLEFNGSDELYFAQQVYCLGKLYNFALIALETNFSTYPQMKLEEWKYPKMYIRETFDGISKKPKLSYGFKTTVLSRPNILADLQAVISNHSEKIKDIKTLCECETFVKNDNGKPEAMEGCHDDHVMALAIAYHARSQQTFDRYVVREEKKEYHLPPELTKSKSNYDFDDDDGEDYTGIGDQEVEGEWWDYV